MDERTDGQTDGRTNGRTNRWPDGRTDRRTNEQTNGQTYGLTEGRIDGRQNLFSLDRPIVINRRFCDFYRCFPQKLIKHAVIEEKSKKKAKKQEKSKQKAKQHESNGCCMLCFSSFFAFSFFCCYCSSDCLLACTPVDLVARPLFVQ